MKKKLLAVLLSVTTVLGTVSPALADEVVEENAIVCEDGMADETLMTGFMPVTPIEADEEMPIDINCDEINILDDIDEITEDGSMVYEHKWDRYSSNHVYNLLSDEEKKIWKAMDALCLETLNGKELEMRNGTYVVGEVFSSYFDNINDMTNLMSMFRYSNPQYYFLAYAYFYNIHNNGYTVTWTVYPEFGDCVARENATQLFEEGINRYKAEITGASDYEKIKSVTDVLTKHLLYNHEEYESEMINELTIDSQYTQSAYSVFVLDITVCTGFSMATELLLNDMGIDCMLVTSERHAWNMVRLGDQWYHVDNTWNNVENVVGMFTKYDYFLRSDEGVKYKDTKGQHALLPFWSQFAPSASLDSGSDIYNAYEPDVSEERVAKPVISIANEKVTIKCETEGAIIYYTTDGINPSDSFSRSNAYWGSFDVPYGKELKVIAVMDGYLDSEIVTLKIDKKPEEPSKSGEWKKDSKGWWYRYSDGTYPKSTWLRVGGKRYHFNGSGYMQTGWIKDNGKWYYLNASGAMATGWVKDGGVWYYLDNNGVMATGWIKDGGKWYYLNGSGAMATGWIKTGGKWYYLNGSGAMLTGWVKDGGKWYYLYPDGHMAANEWVGNYHLNASGAWDI